MGHKNMTSGQLSRNLSTASRHFHKVVFLLSCFEFVVPCHQFCSTTWRRYCKAILGDAPRHARARSAVAQHISPPSPHWQPCPGTGTRPSRSFSPLSFSRYARPPLTHSKTPRSCARSSSGARLCTSPPRMPSRRSRTARAYTPSRSANRSTRTRAGWRRSSRASLRCSRWRTSDTTRTGAQFRARMYVRTGFDAGAATAVAGSSCTRSSSRKR